MTIVLRQITIRCQEIMMVTSGHGIEPPTTVSLGLLVREDSMEPFTRPCYRIAHNLSGHRHPLEDRAIHSPEYAVDLLGRWIASTIPDLLNGSPVDSWVTPRYQRPTGTDELLRQLEGEVQAKIERERAEYEERERRIQEARERREQIKRQERIEALALRRKKAEETRNARLGIWGRSKIVTKPKTIRRMIMEARQQDDDPTGPRKDPALVGIMAKTGWSASELARRSDLSIHALHKVLNCQRPILAVEADAIQLACSHEGIWIDVLECWPNAVASLDDEVFDEDLEEAAKLMIAHAERNPELEAKLLEAMADLDPKMRAVLEGIWLDGKSAKELAAELGITSSHVWRLSDKGLRRLRHPERIRIIEAEPIA